MKYSFVYDASIADNINRKKEDSIEQNSEGFSTVSDEIDHRGSKREVSICGRNIDSDPTGETGIEFSRSLPSPSPKGVRLRCENFLKTDHKI